MSEKLKLWFRNTSFYDWYRSIGYQLEWMQWITGSLDRAAHVVKRRVISSRAKQFKPEIFVETGTLFGDMIHAQRNRFKKLYSIELDDYLFTRATRRFNNYPNIQILHGDSGQKLSEVLKKLEESTLFWLDAHYSGGITAHGSQMTPIFDEIKLILGHSIKDHIIVIDDARLFNGTDGYPTFRALRDFVESIDSDLLVWIENDTITVAHVT